MKTATKRNLIYHTPIRVGDTVSVRTQNQETIQTYMEALARDGIVLTCDRETLDALLPNRNMIAPKQAVTLHTTFSLDPDQGKIESDCDVICVRRLSRDTFQMEMRFQELDDESYAMIDAYVDSALNRPKHALENVA